MRKSLNVYLKLFLVRMIVAFQGALLHIFTRILFRKAQNPKNILIYKVGNIGDIVCAVPALIAIRRHYPDAKITLLTSPGKLGAPGAKELLENAWYLDAMKIYYRDDIDAPAKRKALMASLRRNVYDLFIQLPDDLASCRTLFRNLIFAKMIGARSAFGFRVRTIQLFKKTQVDFSSQKTEVESLLRLLEANGIKSTNVEFDFNVSVEDKIAVANLLKNHKVASRDLLIAISPGGKREGNQWPVERFREVAEYLAKLYGAKVVIVGGKDDRARAQTILEHIPHGVNAAGALSFLGTLELLKKCSFLLSNSTGTIHLAAAAGIPAVGLYTIRDVFGRWFPFGNQHTILKHIFLNCDYRDEACIRKSIEMISVDEVIAALENVINEINRCNSGATCVTGA